MPKEKPMTLKGKIKFKLHSFFKHPNAEENRVDVNRKAARLRGRWGIK